MNILLQIVAGIFAVLQIILFFKLWGATNDIRAIKNVMLQKDSASNDQAAPLVDDNIRVGSIIVEIKTEKQMKVISVENENGINKYICSNNNGITIQKLDRVEIELFDVYWDKNK